MQYKQVSRVLTDSTLITGAILSTVAAIAAIVYFFVQFDSDPSQTIAFRSSLGIERGSAQLLYFLPLAAAVFTVANIAMSFTIFSIDRAMARTLVYSNIGAMLTIIVVTERLLE